MINQGQLIIEPNQYYQRQPLYIFSKYLYFYIPKSKTYFNFRTAQLRGKYPHLKFHDIRGNLNTRLSKLDATDGPYDAIVLAAAGMKRLKFDSRISKVM